MILAIVGVIVLLYVFVKFGTRILGCPPPVYADLEMS
jgi:hypothetical protein